MNEHVWPCLSYRDETDYEQRGFTVADPEGNLWSFGTYAGEAVPGPT